MLALSLALPGLVLAETETPLALQGVPTVDAAMVAKLSGERAVIIDTRALHDFLAGHLPEAIHVDYRERSAREPNFDSRLDDVPAFLRRLGKFAATSQTLVFYCNGTACWKSYKAGTVAKNAGYRHVYWFRGGVTEWQKAGKAVIEE
ncbi:MAG: rhodanese-like domain-containing protein [Rhodocyclaceae bacterium]|nr:rhodanese-like domain-containing protein [Rhodocyclaceae bacterium]